MSREKENLEELFKKFVDSAQAAKLAEDISEGERILRQFSAVEPRDGLRREIKAKIRDTLQRNRKGFKRFAVKVAAVAAGFIILAAVVEGLFEKKLYEGKKVLYASILPEKIWESDDIIRDDADLAILLAEVKEIEEDALAVRLNENGGNGHSEVEELEMELIEINSEFWKG
jgi:hypothetical protein